MTTQCNESYETARMLQQFDEDDCAVFDRAVRGYAVAPDRQQARQIEAVIRTSRLVAGDNGKLPQDVRETLGTIQHRYRAFAFSTTTDLPNTYLEARHMLKSLFF